VLIALWFRVSPLLEGGTKVAAMGSPDEWSWTAPTALRRKAVDIARIRLTV
jgi:hypothetical protein